MNYAPNEETLAWRNFNKAKQERHRKLHEANRAIIDASEIPYIDKGETLLFRQEGKPKVGFYPSTGRWRVNGTEKTFSGGAKAFLAWYAKQGGPHARSLV